MLVPRETKIGRERKDSYGYNGNPTIKLRRIVQRVLCLDQNELSPVNVQDISCTSLLIGRLAYSYERKLVTDADQRYYSSGYATNQPDQQAVSIL